MFLGQFQNFSPVLEIHGALWTHFDTGWQQAVFDPVVAHVTLGENAILGFAWNVIRIGISISGPRQDIFEASLCYPLSLMRDTDHR